MTVVIDPSLQRLQPQIEAVRAEVGPRILPDHLAVLDHQVSVLRAAHHEEGALGRGDRAPDFILPNQRGDIVRLSDHLARGPVALVFFRGPWCPFCRLTLRAWQRQASTLDAIGAGVLAVSPQTIASSAETARDNDLHFDLLSDIGCEIASAFRISYAMTIELRGLYLQFGLHLAERNGGDALHLPMPSTFLLDSAGVIRVADVNCDPACRLDPIDAVRELRHLRFRRRTS